MGNAVVHFEAIGKDAEALQGYYAELVGWTINADNTDPEGHLIAVVGEEPPSG